MYNSLTYDQISDIQHISCCFSLSLGLRIRHDVSLLQVHPHHNGKQPSFTLTNDTLPFLPLTHFHPITATTGLAIDQLITDAQRMHAVYHHHRG